MERPHGQHTPGAYVGYGALYGGGVQGCASGAIASVHTAESTIAPLEACLDLVNRVSIKVPPIGDCYYRVSDRHFSV